MMRPEREDFVEPNLSQIASAAHLTPEKFKQHFAYLVGL
jgi:hypothetical protein